MKIRMFIPLGPSGEFLRTLILETEGGGELSLQGTPNQEGRFRLANS